MTNLKGCWVPLTGVNISAAKHRSSVSVKRQLNHRAWVHRLRECQQSSIERNHVEFATRTLPIMELKKNLSTICEPETRGAAISVWAQIAH